MSITEQNIKKYVVFGAGKFGEKFAQNRQENIAVFLDNKIPYKGEEKYKDTNKKIINPDFYFENEQQEAYIVIAIKEWVDVANYLEEKGKKFYFDYIPISLMEYSNIIDIGFYKLKTKGFDPRYWLKKFANGKKIVACYGECHMTCYQELLNSCHEFVNSYIFISMPTVNDYSNSYYELINRLDIWGECDLILLNRNEKLDYLKGYNSKEILRAKKKNCIVLEITPAFFKGYFPQIRENKGNIVDWHYFTWEDKNINQFIHNNKEIECSTKIQKPDFYDEQWITQYIAKCFNILIKTEENCDIVIADYIQEHYKERILFYSPTHPVNEVLEEIASRILNKLNINEKVKLRKKKALALHETPIYPSVNKILGIQTYNRRFCPGDDENIKMDLGEYIEAYINNARRRVNVYK